MDITSAIRAVQDTWLTISGIKAAPDTPPESINQFPFAVTYEGTGTVYIDDMYSDTFARQTATIVSELHLTRQNLPTAIANAMAYRNSFLDALRDNPTLSGTVMMITQISFQFGKLEYGEDNPTIGYQFTISADLELTQ